MATNYQSSKETTNFARICRLVIDVIPDLLRDLLNTRLPASGLSAVLTTQKRKISFVLKRHQKNILYPQGGVYQGSVKDLDTSLLYILLRNIGNIPSHQKSWGNAPNIADRSLSANIDRLREQRNEVFAHAPNASLSDGDFKASWDIIRQSVEEIQNSELNTGRFVVAVDEILTMEMDHRMTNKYIEALLLDIKDDVSKVKEDIHDTKEDVGAMKLDVGAMKLDIGTVRDDVSSMKDKLNTLSTGTNPKKERDPKLTYMIETTTAMILKEKDEYEFFSTKSLQDAYDKLMKNSLVLIKGNSGDGKTSIALELLRRLCYNEEGQQCRQPLELHDIKDLDYVTPKSQLVIYLDDIFGKNVVCKQDVEEWEKREKSIISKFCRNEHTDGNFLIVAIRSGISNSLTGSCLEKVFTKQNIVDINIDAKEKLELLRLYKPKDNFDSWKDDEEKEIVKCAPDIGFPQCCRLFRDSPTLQTERVTFFKRPFHFLKSSLSKLEDGKCYGLMYLFLNGGKVMEDNLDSNNENIDGNLLEAAFKDDVVEVTPTTELVYNKGRKIEFVKKSLDCLLGWMVKKEFNQNQKVCYKFNHDSIEETLALLYGEKTPIGYIQNCPSKFLSYVTTSKTTPNKVVISSDNQYNAMYARLLGEFESVYSTKRKSDRFYSKYHSITSLDVWTDIQFLRGFITWLSGQNVDKSLFCKIQFDCVGCQRDQNVDKNLCHEIKLRLLNGACSSGSEECALFLLSEGVKPEKETPFFVVEGGSVSVLCKLLEYDVTQTARLHRSRSSHLAWNINVLHEACLSERKDMVTILYNTYPHLVHDTDGKGQSTLHIVAKTGNCDIFKTVEIIILKSLNKDKDEQHKCERVEGCVVHRNCVCAQYMCQLVSNYGETVLHYSCRGGHMDVCKYLCKSYPALTTAVTNNMETVLYYSCMLGHMEVCKYLCDSYPALITAKAYNGETVLHYSCKRGYMEVCKYLCESYPALATAVDNTGETVLFYSFRLRHMEFCKYLCESYPELTKAVTFEGETLLHYSCRFGHIEFCKYLCELYPELTTAVTYNGETVLHHSCMFGHMEFCKYLYESYPALPTAVTNNGVTVLHYCCIYGHIEFCKYLCESYPELTTAVDNDGKTVLHYSCMHAHMEVCKYLCESYPELTTAVDNDRKTVLHYSCMRGLTMVFKYLCESYPELTAAVNNEKKAVLHYSCMHAHMEVCKYLCESYPELTTAVDNDGKTVLHYSCMYEHTEVCKYLCESYPELTTAVDNDGKTVLHYSCMYGRMDVFRYLLLS